MIVIAASINNPKHRKIHRDFIRETCLSFGVSCIWEPQNLPAPSNRIVALKHDKGEFLEDLDISVITTVLVGCDDTNNDWMEAYTPVRIRTPRNYYLWSSVALGIFLYEFNRRVDG